MNNKTEVKFTWPTSGTNPDEINSITMNIDNIPRVGELLFLNVTVSADETVSKTLRVKDVAWAFTEKSCTITIFCS